MKTAQVHRFRNKVAVSLPGKGETVYMTVYMTAFDALQLSAALDDVAWDIRHHTFTDSKLAARTIPLSDEG